MSTETFLTAIRVRHQLNHISRRRVDARVLKPCTVVLIGNKTYIFKGIKQGEYGLVAAIVDRADRNFTHDLRSFELTATPLYEE